MWNALRRRIHSGLRYKLLALVILPLLLSMVATLGYAFYWVNAYTHDILRANAMDNLTLARHALRDVQQDYQSHFKQLADSESFRKFIDTGDSAGVQRALRRLRQEKGFAFVHLTGLAGNWLHEPVAPSRSSKPSPLTDRAARGLAGGAIELFRFEDLLREDPLLPDLAGIVPYAPMLRLVEPVSDRQGKVVAVLDGGVLLIHAGVTDAIRARVFTPGGTDQREAMVALLLDRARISTSGAGVVGEEVPVKLRDQVMGRGDVWVGRDRIGERWFISAYGPLFDVHGSRIGMLQVGLPEDVFGASQTRAVVLLLGIFLAAALIAAAVALRGARSVWTPIEKMTAVVRATQAGDDLRIGPVRTHDEIGELARQFDVMLDQLAGRNQELKRAAATLEGKVAERTRELEVKNTDLEQTIHLLQQTREQLLMAEKLSAVGVLSAGVAHEINNPLAVIQGNMEVLAAELGDAAKPVEREIELIVSQVDRIRHIVTSLLQFARPADIMATITEVDVNHAVGDVLPLVGYALKKKAISLHTRLRASGVIRINLFEFEQVLINLLINAANAVSPGGRIEVETVDCGGDGVEVRVSDNGAGIPAALLTRVFDPFFTTDSRHGTGLGLSVSYGIIRHYGGDISVESTVGKGSVFELLLRREPIMAGTVTAQTAEPSTERRMRTRIETTEADHEQRDIAG